MVKSRARRSGGAGRPARGAAHAESDELIRAELSGDELMDELDQFEASRERKLLNSASGVEFKTGASSRARSAARHDVLAFDDDSGSDDDYYDQTTMGVAGDQAAENDLDEDEEEADENRRAGDNEAGVPSDRAWGKRKNTYYNAEYVDEDWRGATREETLELADMEEREARAIQRRLAEEIEAADLELALTGPDARQEASKPSTASSTDMETVVVDTSSLSRQQQMALLRTQNPELLPLIQEWKTRWTELCTVVDPLYRLVEEGRIAPGPGADYVRCKQRLLLLYCLNISFYLQLRAAGAATDRHPVMRRIAQFGKLLHSAQHADQAMESEMARVSRLIADGVELKLITSSASTKKGTEKSSSGKRLRPSKHRPPVDAAKTSSSAVDHQLAALTMEIDALEQQKAALAKQKEETPPTFTELRQAGQTKHNPLAPFRKRERPAQPVQVGNQQSAEGVDGAADGATVAEEADKRSITYQMARNKGLMPKRSKESRNPRVKHKNKFQKALKKRRSLVRLPKKEEQKYGGEVFGIRMGAVKSVPLK